MPIIPITPATPKTILSSHPFQDPQGNVLSSGFLVLDLNTMAVVTGQGGQVVPLRVSIPLDVNGLIPAGTVLWGNDQLSPSNTFYSARIYNSNNLFVGGPNIWLVVGASPIDVSLLANITPVATNPNAVLQNPSGSQTILNFPLAIENNLLTNRIYINQGNPLINGDFVLTGWGSGNTLSVVGTDPLFVMTITAGTTPTVAPTAVLTYHDGTWGTNAPMCFANMTGGTGAVSDLSTTSTNTTLTIKYDGLPVATKTYIFFVLSVGR